ncbi:TetR/AcrR family transcriptional regulator [Pedobacter punctiformis]|uniref:TetR/AcrR family transcriptional regulator n=1 Tax=Pedobacter punctiformis TaxID=3004097 RepID=A0ABT4L8B1_9SPHI|nr:TetR/AcrR family transcriptional regulator [Pedobacter sp. HCMS5-2]MCZ4244167.1 TetR/AcrR family transcriptional regulator [Pedobacter sp. HCMS5-2]
MMEDNPVKTRIRNKENSKQQFLDAVGKILKTQGYSALKINNIATTAGLDKKLIYNYFGGLEGLLDEYIKTQDFWSNVKSEIEPNEITDGGKEFITNTVLEQFDYVFRNKEFQKVLLWRLSEPRNSLKKLTDEQEANGEFILQNIMDTYFAENSEDSRAAMALIVSGAYYLNLYAEINGNTFCGIDIKSETGRNQIKKAIAMLIEQVYTFLK